MYLCVNINQFFSFPLIFKTLLFVRPADILCKLVSEKSYKCISDIISKVFVLPVGGIK